MLGEIEREASIERRLRESLKAGTGLSAQFQPQVSRSGEIVALEALLRWTDTELGCVSPAEAVKVAEEACLSDEIGYFIARQACQAAQALPAVTVSLNVSSGQLLAPHFWDRLSAILCEEGVDPSRMQLEIPERTFAEREEVLVPILRRIAAAGYRLTVDNYGTSTASLSYLKRMNICAVKFDRSLLETVRTFDNIAVMRAKVALAKSLGLTALCAGIADERDKAIALQAGCDVLQGFALGVPQALEAFTSPESMSRAGQPKLDGRLVGTNQLVSIPAEEKIWEERSPIAADELDNGAMQEVG